MRKAYIASYKTNAEGEEIETILSEDEFWSPTLSRKWDELYEKFKHGDDKLMGWYSDEYNVSLIASLKSGE